MLNELRKLVIAQKTAVLPGEAPGPALGTLHAAMVHYDQLVSTAVIHAIQGLPFDFPGDEVKKVRGELDELFSSAPAGRDVESYRKYRQRLDQMSDLAEQVAKESF